MMTGPEQPRHAAVCPFLASGAMTPARDMAAVGDHGSAPEAPATPSASRPVRWLYVVVGLVCFGLAIAGAVLPGLPTTVFVLVGSYCLTRSCPWLERRLMATRLLRPYAKYLDPATPFPWRARIFAMSAMWVSIAVSSVLLVAGGAAAWIVAAVIAAGVAGTVCIARFRRGVVAAA